MAVDLVKAGNYSMMVAGDQLSSQRAEGKVFAGFTEGAIKFAPTYRMDPHAECEFSNKRNQVPS